MFDTNTAAGVKHTTGGLRLSQRAEQLPPKQGCRFDSCDLNNDPFHQRWSLSAVPVSVIGGELSAVKESLGFRKTQDRIQGEDKEMLVC